MNIERVGIWVRVSPSKDLNESPEHHLQRANAYAQAKGWQIAETYTLEWVSGKTVHEHEEMARMLRDIETGRIQGLIFSSLARLARTKAALWQVAEHFRKHQAALVCLDFNLDTSTISGELLYSIMASVVEWEGKMISDRIAASVPVRAKLGKNTGGAGVYGYHWVEGKLVPHPEEAPVRVLIYELYREHQRFLTVARILNERNHLTRAGSRWSASSVRYMVNDTTAKGVRRANYSTAKMRAGRAGGTRKPEQEWVWQEVPPIVSEELWDECQQIVKGNARPRGGGHKKAGSFSGILTCGHCHQSMYLDSMNQPGNCNHKLRCRKCRAAVSMRTLDAIFSQHLEIFFNDPSAFSAHVNRLTADVASYQNILEKQKRQLDQAQKDLERIEGDYISGELDARRYEALTAKIEERMQGLQDDAAKTASLIAGLKDQVTAAGRVAKDLADKSVLWDDFNPQEKNLFAREIVRRLEFKDNEILIELCMPLSNNFELKLQENRGFQVSKA